MDKPDYWDRDDIQFARLLAEIRAIGLTHKQYAELCVSTSLNYDQLDEVFDRAEETFEAMKENLDFIDSNCAVCNNSLAKSVNKTFSKAEKAIDDWSD